MLPLFLTKIVKVALPPVPPEGFTESSVLSLVKVTSLTEATSMVPSRTSVTFMAVEPAWTPKRYWAETASDGTLTVTIISWDLPVSMVTSVELKVNQDGRSGSSETMDSA